MRSRKLLLIATMGLGLMLGAAACTGDMSGTGVDAPQEPGAPTAQPGGNEKPTEAAANPGAPGGKPAPGQPGGQSGDPQDLAAALALHGDTERIAAAILAEDCGSSATCASELDALTAFVATACAGGNSDCPATIGKFGESLSAAQKNGQAPIPVTFPQVKDVAVVLAMMNAAGSGAGSGATGNAPAVVVAGVAEALAAMTAADTVDWKNIQDKIAEAAPAEGGDIAMQVEAALKGMTNDATATGLVNGEAVPAAEAALLLSTIANGLK